MALVVLVAAVACSVSYSADSPTATTDAGVDASTVVDSAAAPDVADAGVADAPAPDAAEASAVFDPTPPPSSAPSLVCPSSFPPDLKFCFSFRDNASVPSLTVAGWLLNETGGAMTLAGTLGAHDRSVRAATTVTPGAKDVSLVWNRWGPGGSELLGVAVGQGLELRFKVKIERAETYAMLGGFTLDGTTFGLAVHPKACGAGVDCLGEVLRDGQANLAGASVFAPNEWYDVHVRATRGSERWNGNITVGGRTVATRADAFPANASDNAPARLELGVLRTATNATRAEVSIDDIELRITN